MPFLDSFPHVNALGATLSMKYLATIDVVSREAHRIQSITEMVIDQITRSQIVLCILDGRLIPFL
jgi:hypothetical protein